MNYHDRLRLIALHDAAFLEACRTGTAHTPPVLATREITIARLAALIAMGGSVASYGDAVEAALDSGLSTAELVDVLVQVMPITGTPRVVGEAPKLALALGYDVEAALEDVADPVRRSEPS